MALFANMRNVRTSQRLIFLEILLICEIKKPVLTYRIEIIHQNVISLSISQQTHEYQFHPSKIFFPSQDGSPYHLQTIMILMPLAASSELSPSFIPSLNPSHPKTTLPLYYLKVHKSFLTTHPTFILLSWVHFYPFR